MAFRRRATAMPGPRVKQRARTWPNTSRAAFQRGSVSSERQIKGQMSQEDVFSAWPQRPMRPTAYANRNANMIANRPQTYERDNTPDVYVEEIYSDEAEINEGQLPLYTSSAQQRGRRPLKFIKKTYIEAPRVQDEGELMMETGLGQYSSDQTQGGHYGDHSEASHQGPLQFRTVSTRGRPRTRLVADERRAVMKQPTYRQRETSEPPIYRRGMEYDTSSRGAAPPTGLPSNKAVSTDWNRGAPISTGSAFPTWDTGTTIPTSSAPSQWDGGTAITSSAAATTWSDQIDSSDLTDQASEFNAQVRSLNKIIRFVHHLGKFSETNDPPQTISNMTKNLITTIKPAVATSRTLEAIRRAAKSWEQNIIQVLRDHYEWALEAELQGLTEFICDDWEEQFLVATSWAKKSLNVSQDTLDHAELLIADKLAQLQPVDLTLSPPASSKPVAPVNVAQHTPTPHKTQPVFVQSSASSYMPSCGRGLSRSIQASRLQQERAMALASDLPQRDVRLLDQIHSPAGTTRVQVHREEDPEMPALIPVDSDPAEERYVLHSELIAQEAKVKINIASPFKAQQKMDPGVPEEVLVGALGSLPEKREGEGLQTLNTSSLQVTSEQSTISTTDREKTCSPVLLCESTIVPTVHQHTNNKQSVWRLQVAKETLIIGDSNLARISGCEEDTVQIDSFPGGSFQHVDNILSDVSVTKDVKHVILSFGVNSRAWAPQPHTYKNIDRAVQACKEKFPDAEVKIQLINYSRGLPAQEQDNLESINAFIRDKHQYIPKIGRPKFSVCPDKLHWTSATANNMLQHWLSFVSWS